MIPGTRLTDILNVKIKDFIPLTEAKIIDDVTNAVYAEIPYVAIYRDSIIAVHPTNIKDSLKESKAEEAEFKGETK